MGLNGSSHKSLAPKTVEGGEMYSGQAAEGDREVTKTPAFSGSSWTVTNSRTNHPHGRAGRASQRADTARL